VLKPWPRRDLLAFAMGATLATAALPRQAAAASDGGLGKLRETPGGRPVPEGVVFQDAEGRETGLASFRGRGLVVNFWATWCPPCVAEMPALDRARAALAGDEIEVLPLSSDRGGRAQVDPFYARTGLKHLGVWLDPRGAAGRAFGIRGLPTTILIDRDGREVGRIEGPAEWDSPEAQALVRHYARS
jgi:thiol-disulfide isomerase/thioredoxin